MMRFPQTLRRSLRAFRTDESGSSNIELVFMVPLLAAITFGLLTFFTAFQAKTEATRAATVVSDMVTRETNPLTPTYLAGIFGLLDTMIASDDEPEYRLTAFTWNKRRGEYRVRWSKEESSYGSLTHAELNAVADKLPTLKPGQRAILLETWVDYDPLTNFGLAEATTFENFLVAAPRFVPQLCWMASDDADATTAQC